MGAGTTRPAVSRTRQSTTSKRESGRREGESRATATHDDYGSPSPVSLPSPPNDGITSLRYLPPSCSPGGASWDGALRIHDATAKSLAATQAMDSGPLLSMAVGGASSSLGRGAVFAGGNEGSVKMFDVATSAVSTVGRHSPDAETSDLIAGKKKAGVSCLSSIGEHLVASAGWDAKFHVWDLRRSSAEAVATVELPGKAFDMDVSSDGKRAVVATSGRRNCFVDLRKPEPEDEENDDDEKMATLALDRESSLKYQTRCVRFFPDGQGIAAGSIEGRVAVEYLDDLGTSSGSKKKYAFKCHRAGEHVYPVNAIAFYSVHGTFATGGADGTVVTWDGGNKKKLSGIAKCPTSVACLAFNHDGTQIAIASSYTYEEGERDHPREEIYVRDVLEGEVRPKSKK
ncbi:hypothetical protein ACHAWF_006273 [Thalassiosira exigua]